MLRKTFWMVAGMVGAGSLLGAKAAPAHATGSEGPTTFTATGGATAVSAQSDSGAGVNGFSASGAGVWATSHSGYGLSAQSGTGVSIEAYSMSVIAVEAQSTNGIGLYAQSDSGPGLHAVSKSNIGAILENTSGVAVQVKGHIQIQGDCIGQTYMEHDDDQIVVYSPAATLNSLILLTPLDPCNAVLSVTRGTGLFTIHITRFDTGALKFDTVHIAYLIVN